MEKQILGRDSNNHKIQILDITNHLQTLIRLGYADANLSVPQVQVDKSGSIFLTGNPTIMNEEWIWRRWQAKHSVNFAGHNEATDNFDRSNCSTRRRPVDFTFEQLQGSMSNAATNKQVKQTPSNLNMMNYNGLILRNNSPSRNDLNKKMFNDDSCMPVTDIRNTFKEYCHHCTIHGLKYVGDSSISTFERIFWIFSFVLAIIGAAYFIWHVYSKYLLSPIIISRSSESVSIEQFPFPALTVCNMNNAKRSIAEQIIRNNDSLQKVFLEDICDIKNDSLNIQRDGTEESAEWENILKFLLSVSQKCPQMLHFCQWHGNNTNCSELFNPVLSDEGLCCNFNSMPNITRHPPSWEELPLWYPEKTIPWTPEYTFKSSDLGTSLPRRAYGSGSNFGLTLVLDVEADEYYCSSTVSVGFKMLLHSPVENPQIADYGFTLSPGKETRVIITPHITDADPSIKNIPPKIRQCYFLNEKKLRYYTTYTQRNCILECEANFTFELCHCMQYYMPVGHDTIICGKKDDECALTARRIIKTKVYEEDDPLTMIKTPEAPSCKCYPGCHEINYSTEISQSMLMTTFDIPSEYQKNNGQYFEKNIAIVHIFFIESSYMKYVKNELYGFTDLLSNMGGLLGLFMGFSLLSVIEIFYYFTLRMWWRVCKNKPRKDDKSRFIIQPFVKRHDAVYPFVQ